ncbi:homocysteine S-methyltransferase family protein [Gellertiella hungarica]|uniref:S-methylmethionine-dependent homocysteine/selenocysteine methylase n=1 Tax=Gellertiella hungarica TaxID=1572859 RepID=A0A7W6NJK0_9HYPH|nr:homocysteine S-methyltransferase family protein [Gellertiella hungarica]MBB4063367.1 S-methylmethionine-dependent homocysteine/selenocysteine methylase [Gellertiella hungarica]
MRHEITLLDGGMGRELARSGAPFRQPEWSALALIESPGHVGKAHAAFASAGADVITTNSYAVVPFHIGEERFRTDGFRLARLAGEIAREVADASGVRVAGSLPPVLGSYRPDLFTEAEATPILKVLIEALSPSADLWLAETLSSTAEARLVRALLGHDRRPLWISFTLDDARAKEVEAGAIAPSLRSGESIAAAAEAARACGAEALLFNCSQPEVMEAAVRAARRELPASIRIGIYANAFATEADDTDANADLHDIRPDLTPDNYRRFAEKWVKAGASMIGGCCGIGPEHIEALSSALKAD